MTAAAAETPIEVRGLARLARFVGLPVTRAKSQDLITHLPAATSRGWMGVLGNMFGRVHEPFTGAWQRNIEWSTPEVLAQSTLWACVTLIMSDIGKIGVNLVQVDSDGIWSPTENPAYSPVLRKPNHYQNRIKFFEQWVVSKLTRGNTYVLKARDNRTVVTKLFILDPARVTVLVAPDGSVYYDLAADNLAGLQQSAVQVPASEIIHDVGVALYHPLCGLSPIVACGLAAMQALKIQNSSAKFFANHSKPGGVLTAPNQISQATADRIQAHWEANFGGEDNVGKVAVLGDGLKYEPMSETAVESQLIEQLKWGDERICSCFHVPPFMVGVGPMPTYNNIEALNQQYYSQCLHSLIESIELCLDEGLGLSANLGIEFDIEALIRMDSSTKMKNATEGVKGGVYSPNEARKKFFSLKPVKGGEAPYLQNQNWSLEDLAERREMGLLAPAPVAPKPLKDREEPEPPPADEETKALIGTLFRAALLEKRAA